MKLRNKLSYIALGGLLMLIGMLASSVFMPNLFAQRDKFGLIECTELRVLGKDGLPFPKVALGVDEHGSGLVSVYGKDATPKVALGVGDEHGSGSVVVTGKDISMGVSITVDDEHGGLVGIIGKDGIKILD